MTCGGCVAAVTKNLSEVDGVTDVVVDLASGKTTITMQKAVSLDALKKVLGAKYQIQQEAIKPADSIVGSEEVSKLKQLRPLLLIFAYLIAASILLNYKDWNWSEAMLDFMGLFYIVFSFFKFLDLKGFPASFSMYDPLAKAVPFYGWVYPFLELLLGLMFLMRIELKIALLVTVVVLGITTIGVTRTLLQKKAIQCACLGTALKLPMTEATFIENSVMLVMAVIMLL